MNISDVRVEARVQMMGEHKGKVAWDIYVDDKHHGGGLNEPTLRHALMQAGFYVEDLEQLEAVASEDK